MTNSRSVEEAWIVVKRIWSQMRTEPQHGDGLAYVEEEHLWGLFEALWDAQFEEDRREVRASMEELTRLVVEAAPDAD